MYTTNTARYAERELSILSQSLTNPDNRPIIEPFRDEILALCEKFGKSGQSGGSAPYTASALSQAIKKLCLQEPICEITGLPEEWVDMTHMSHRETIFQNTRCSPLFKIGDGKCYYLDAIVWKTQKGVTWSGTAIRNDGSKIRSRQFVKSFPFKPKTFYIDVIETEIAPDDWEFHVKNERQLKSVFKYYDLYQVNG